MKNIDELVLGFSDSENYSARNGRDIFDNIFVKDSTLETIAKPTTYYVIGEKGSGKTARSVYFRHLQSRTMRAESRYIREVEYQKFHELKVRNDLKLSGYTEIWKVCLLRLTAGIIKRTDLTGLPFRSSSNMSKVRDSIAAYNDKSFAPEIVFALDWIEESKQKGKLSLKVGTAEAEARTQLGYSESKFQLNLRTLEQQLRDALHELKLKRDIVLFIDGIDHRPESISLADYFSCLRGLESAMWELNTNFFDKIQKSSGIFRIVLLLRSDIFAMLSIPNSASKLKDNSAVIHYSPGARNGDNLNLFSIGDALLSKQQYPPENDLAKGKAWNHYFPWDKAPDANVAFRGILKLIRPRPRDLIVTMQILQECQIEMGWGGENAFRKEVFQSRLFRGKLSAYLANAIRDELLFYYTQADYERVAGVLQSLKFGGAGSFNFSSFDDLFNRNRNGGTIAQDTSHIDRVFLESQAFLQLLYDMNIVGVVENDDSGAHSEVVFRGDQSRPFTMPLSREKKYKVHEGFAMAFGLEIE